MKQIFEYSLTHSTLPHLLKKHVHGEWGGGGRGVDVNVLNFNTVIAKYIEVLRHFVSIIFMIKQEMKKLTKSSLVDFNVSRTTVTPSLVSSI